MKGHIRERSPGRWAIVIELRDPATGKRRRKWHKFAGTKRKAQDECARLIAELNGGLYIEPAKITVGQFLDRWLEHIKPLVSPRTHERYGELVTKNIKPLLGAVLLTKLLPMQISEAYAKALSSGHRKGKGGLAPSTVRYTTTTTDTPPVIQINGENPALIQVGNTYSDLGATITGPTADLNLGVTTYVNGIETSPVLIDTSAAATDTIDYVVSGQNGLTSTSTRTVIIEASPSVIPSDNASTTNATTTTPA